MDEEKRGRGFAGLSSLISPVDDKQPSSSKPDSNESASPTGPRPSSRAAEPTANQSSGGASSDLEPRIDGSEASAARGVLISAFLFILVVFWGVLRDGQSGESARPEASAGRPPAELAAPPPANRSQAAPSIESLDFALPPYGRDKALSISQIRWCLREEIWVDVLRNKATSNPQIDAFNVRVDSYNRRCGEYRYRRGDLQRARSQVHPMRGELERAVVPPWVQVPDFDELGFEILPAARVPPEFDDLGFPLPSAAAGTLGFAPSSELREIQEARSALGYQPGTSDRIDDTSTRAAISEFYVDFSLAEQAPTGAELLAQLE